MKNEIIIFFFQLFIVCSCYNREGNMPNNIEIATNIDSNKQTNAIVWREYKRVTAANRDVLPYSNCFVIIEGSKMTYKREGKVIYTDSIYLDTKYKVKRYRFINHTADVMIITGDNDKELLIKRYYPEGDYEYFRKEEYH